MESILAVTFIFGGGSVFLLAISPVGRAIANRIQGGGPPGGGVSRESVERMEAAHQDLLEDMELLRHDVMEIQERLDFAERLLAQHKQHQLPSPGGVVEDR